MYKKLCYFHNPFTLELQQQIWKILGFERTSLELQYTCITTGSNFFFQIIIFHQTYDYSCRVEGHLKFKS